MSKSELFDEIEQFLDSGGAASPPRPQAPHWRDYRVEQGPPDDGDEWFRLETMEGKVWWESYSSKKWPPETS